MFTAETTRPRKPPSRLLTGAMNVVPRVPLCAPLHGAVCADGSKPGSSRGRSRKGRYNPPVRQHTKPVAARTSFESVFASKSREARFRLRADFQRAGRWGGSRTAPLASERRSPLSARAVSWVATGSAWWRS